MGRASSHMAEIHLSPVAQSSNVLPQSSILTAQALQGASPWRRRARPGSRSRAGPSWHDITHRARGHGSCRSCCMRHQGHGWHNIAHRARDRPIASSSIKLNLSEDTVQQNESRYDATMQKQLDQGYRGVRKCYLIRAVYMSLNTEKFCQPGTYVLHAEKHAMFMIVRPSRSPTLQT